MDLLPSKDRVEVSAPAQLMLRDYAGHRWPTLNHKARMSRLAGALGLGFRRVRAIYQADPSVRLRADELAAIEALSQRQIEEANRNDFADLQDRVARLEAALVHQEEERPHHQVAALQQANYGRRRGDVAGSHQRG